MTVPHAGLQAPADSGGCPNAASDLRSEAGSQAVKADKQTKPGAPGSHWLDLRKLAACADRCLSKTEFKGELCDEGVYLAVGGGGARCSVFRRRRNGQVHYFAFETLYFVTLAGELPSMLPDIESEHKLYPRRMVAFERWNNSTLAAQIGEHLAGVPHACLSLRRSDVSPVLKEILEAIESGRFHFESCSCIGDELCRAEIARDASDNIWADMGAPSPLLFALILAMSSAMESDIWPRSAAPAVKAKAGGSSPDAGLELRDDLISRLLYASRDLAESRLLEGGANALSWVACVECGEFGPRGDTDFHGEHCKAGRTLGIIAALIAAPAPASNPIRKEAAQGQEGARAGDGKRSRGDFGEPWERRIDDVLQTLSIYDNEGTLITGLPKCNQESLDWANRIVACVNSCAGMEDKEMLLATGGEYFLVRVEDREEFYGFTEAWKANPAWRKTVDFSGANAKAAEGSKVLLDACRAQHEAMDTLFALLVDADPLFRPSQSGQPWQAMVQATKAITDAVLAQKGQTVAEAINVRRPADRPCPNCGERRGQWYTEFRVESQVELRTLGDNQYVSAGPAGVGHVIWSHNCASAVVQPEGVRP